MIINHTYKFIFLHVPKTAGTSITSYLSSFTGWNDIELGGTAYGEQIQEIFGRRFKLHKHSTAQQIRQIIGEGVWGEYFRFAVVRHPLDRLVSAYHFYRKWDHPSAHPVREFAAFREFVLSDYFAQDRKNTTRPTGSQAAFLRIGDQIAIDKVCRFESLADDMAAVATRLGLTPPQLPQLNATERLGYEAYYSQEIVDLVAQIYRDDFDEFRYGVPNLADPRFSAAQ
jgi:hypothetical protein